MTHSGGAPAFATPTYFPDRQVSVVVIGNRYAAPAPEVSAPGHAAGPRAADHRR